MTTTDLRHLLTVGLGVERSLGEQDWVLLGRHTQLVVERVMPDLLHVVPVGDDAVLDRVLQGQDTSLALCLVADIAVLLTHPDHHTLSTHNSTICERNAAKISAVIRKKQADRRIGSRAAKL